GHVAGVDSRGAGQRRVHGQRRHRGKGLARTLAALGTSLVDEIDDLGAERDPVRVRVGGGQAGIVLGHLVAGIAVAVAVAVAVTVTIAGLVADLVPGLVAELTFGSTDVAGGVVATELLAGFGVIRAADRHHRAEAEAEAEENSIGRGRPSVHAIAHGRD